MEIPECPLCKKEIFSELGKACKMCGMHLEYQEKEFCSKKCETKYGKINSGKIRWTNP